jgi:hypothetical protein
MTDRDYSARFNMVMLPEERAMLQALASAQGLRESDILRQAIRRMYADAFGEKRPGKPRPKYNARAVIEAKTKRATRKQ